MSAYPPTTSLILLAVLTSPRDLEIARLLGWYRIPLRCAPKVIDVDYLAFYQTAAFGDQHRWCVEHFAAVRGYELTTRAELFHDQTDHPRAGEEYFKVQLGELQSLPQPIQAGRWRRITFLYTTGELLHKAHTVNDLVVRSEERALLWRSLRERARHGGSYQPDQLPEFELDAALLAMLGDLDKIAETQIEYPED